MTVFLVADDTKFYRQSICHILEQAGHKVIAACDGKEASKILSESDIDFLVSDIYMPEKDGYELILETNKKFPHIKIIAMTAGTPSLGNQTVNRDDAGDVLQTAALFGADAIMPKPFEAPAFLQAIKDVLAGVRCREKH